MPVNRRKFLSLTSAGLASTMVSPGVWSLEAEGLATAHGPVASKKSFSKVIRQAKAGDTIVIANGRYNGWSADLDCQGTSKRPVTIRPQSAGGVVFTGSSHISITGSYVTVIGLRFEQCNIKENLLEFKRSDHCRIVNCVFENSGHSGGAKAPIGISPGASNNHITDCRFSNISARCVNLTMNDDIYEHGVPSGNVIRNNHFKDIPRAGKNGREAIKIGTNQPTYGHIVVGTIVEENVFDRCNGEAEIISNKCAGNIYRRNVFNQCDGELVMRGGENCLIEGNRFFEGKGGIRLCGTGHVVKDNVIVNSRETGIRLFFGMTKEQGGHYQAAGQCLITNNTIVNAKRVGILLGDGRGNNHKENGIQNVAPEGNRLLNNIITGSTGDLFRVDHAPGNLVTGNLFFLQGDAIVSSPGEEPVYADPLFRDPVSGDFRPSQGSPALNSDPVKGASHHGPLPGVEKDGK
jgi:poly(beta-D-mannuronate) lyase